MTPRREFSPQTLSVLAALSEQPSQWQHGYALATKTGLKSGTLYPILIRLADRGLVEACWQEEARPGRPRRHLYRLTAGGLASATGALAASAQQPAGRRGGGREAADQAGHSGARGAMSWLGRAGARLLPARRRDWAEAVWAEAREVPAGWPRLAWRAGGVWLIVREAQIMRGIGTLLLFAAAAGAAAWSAWPGHGGHAVVARVDIVATVLATRPGRTPGHVRGHPGLLGPARLGRRLPAPPGTAARGPR